MSAFWVVVLVWGAWLAVVCWALGQAAAWSFV